MYVKDSSKVFDIEMQTTVNKWLPKRARYYQSIIDVDMLNKGHDYKELRESYIIFICTEDMFNKNLPMYTFDRTCREDKELILNDGTHVIFFNAAAYLKEENEKIREVLEYFETGKPQSDFTAKLQSVVDNTKTNTKWRHKYMTLEMKYREYREQGIKRGIHKANHKIANNLKKMGMSYSQISQATGLSVEEIQKI